MRILLLLCCLTLFSVTICFAQEKKWGFGIALGENTAWITSDLNASPRISMQAGVAVEYFFNEKLSFQTRLAYSPLKATINADRFGSLITTYQFSLQGLEVPLLFCYQWHDSKRFKLAIGAGGHARYFFKNSIRNTNEWADSDGEHKWVLQFDLSDETKKFVISPAVQATADFKLNDKRSLGLILSYSRSLTSVLPKEHLYYGRGTGGDFNFYGYLGKNSLHCLSLITQITF